MNPVAPLSPAEARDRKKAGTVVLLDVRTPAEFRSVHAEGAINVPLDILFIARLAGPWRQSIALNGELKIGGEGLEADDRHLVNPGIERASNFQATSAPRLSLQQAAQRGGQQRQHGLDVGVAEATVELDHLRPLGGQRESDVQAAGVRRTAALHLGEGGSHDLLHHGLDDACRQQQFGEGWFPSFDAVPQPLAPLLSAAQVRDARARHNVAGGRPAR